MIGKTFARSAAAAVALLGGTLLFAQEPPATLTIHPDQPEHAVSPMLYGLFFEEINHAGDGGLYAEKLADRAFVELEAGRPAGTRPGWYPVEQGGATVTLARGQAAIAAAFDQLRWSAKPPSVTFAWSWHRSASSEPHSSDASFFCTSIGSPFRVKLECEWHCASRLYWVLIMTPHWPASSCE